MDFVGNQQCCRMRHRFANGPVGIYSGQYFLRSGQRDQSARLAPAKILLIPALFGNQQTLGKRPLLVDPLDLAAKPRLLRGFADFIGRVFVAAFGPDRFPFA